MDFYQKAIEQLEQEILAIRQKSFDKLKESGKVSLKEVETRDDLIAERLDMIDALHEQSKKWQEIRASLTNVKMEA